MAFFELALSDTNMFKKTSTTLCKYQLEYNALIYHIYQNPPNYSIGTRSGVCLRHIPFCEWMLWLNFGLNLRVYLGLIRGFVARVTQPVTVAVQNTSLKNL